MAGKKRIRSSLLLTIEHFFREHPCVVRVVLVLTAFLSLGLAALFSWPLARRDLLSRGFIGLWPWSPAGWPSVL